MSSCGTVFEDGPRRQRSLRAPRSRSREAAQYHERHTRPAESFRASLSASCSCKTVCEDKHRRLHVCQSSSSCQKALVHCTCQTSCSVWSSCLGSLSLHIFMSQAMTFMFAMGAVRTLTKTRQSPGGRGWERWGAGVETQKNVRGEIGGWGRVPFNETYAPSLSTIYDGA